MWVMEWISDWDHIKNQSISNQTWFYMHLRKLNMKMGTLNSKMRDQINKDD